MIAITTKMVTITMGSMTMTTVTKKTVARLCPVVRCRIALIIIFVDEVASRFKLLLP